MSYSTHADLRRLLDDVDAFTWQFSDLRFFGTGINDLQPSGVGIAPQSLSQMVITVRIVLAYSSDWLKIQWNIDGGGWRGDPTYILDANAYSLDFGIAVTFSRAMLDQFKYHSTGSYWVFTATPPDSASFRDLAYDWLNDNLESYHSVPFSSPSKTVILAEATYSLYLILRANNDPRSEQFHQEALRLVELMTLFKEPTTIPVEAGAILRTAEAERIKEIERSREERAQLREARRYARRGEVRATMGV